MLSTTRPTPLRLAGFLATVLGGLLMGLGSVLAWGRVGLTDTKGVDILPGQIALAVAVLALIGIPAIRAVRSPAARRAIAWATIAGSVLAAGLAAWALADRVERIGGVAIEREARELARQTGFPEDRLAADLRAQTTLTIKPGVYVTMLGVTLGIAGGALGLEWARRTQPGGAGAEAPGAPTEP